MPLPLCSQEAYYSAFDYLYFLHLVDCEGVVILVALADSLLHLADFANVAGYVVWLALVHFLVGVTDSAILVAPVYVADFAVLAVVRLYYLAVLAGFVVSAVAHYFLVDVVDLAVVFVSQHSLAGAADLDLAFVLPHQQIALADVADLDYCLFALVENFPAVYFLFVLVKSLLLAVLLPEFY